MRKPGKGNELVREAHKLLRDAPITFYGNVEGRDLFQGTTDVFVTDGFTGNVVLKLAEGEAKVIFGWIRDALTQGGLRTKLGGALVRDAFKGIAAKLDPAEYGAQPLLGVNGPAFIGHRLGGRGGGAKRAPHRQARGRGAAGRADCGGFRRSHGWSK